MDDIDRNIAHFNTIKHDLEKENLGEWVLMHDCVIEGFYPDFNAAAEVAVEKFGRGPYLIKQVGAPPLTLPASVVHFGVYA